MRILVTGAGGNLGRAVMPAMVAAGHQPVLLDSRPLDTDQKFILGDVRDADVVTRAMEGADVVVHGAALHGIHLSGWSAEDFWSINVTGTFNVYEAARRSGVRRVVLGSSMAVYGNVGGAGEPWQVVTEETPIKPTNLYGLTKVLSEDIARYHAHDQAVSTVSLRFGMFVPETFERYGFRLLFGGVDDRDVAQSVLLALDHPDRGFDAFNIMADSGLTADDLSPLDADLPTVLDQRWPGTTELVRERGLDLAALVWGRTIFPVDHARSVLRYSPQHNFDAFLEAFRNGDHSYYPNADEAWWGADRPS